MKTLIVDDAMPNADEVRAEVLKAGFGDVEFNGQTYHGINCSVHPDWWYHIGKAFGMRINSSLSFFCLSGEEHVLESKAYIHVDHVFSPYVAIVYLSDPVTIPSGSGTAFWRQKKYEWERMPSTEHLAAVGLTVPGFIEHWKDPDQWEQTELVEERFNRLAIFEANRFHSRWPIKGRGTTPESSRLIYTSWFDSL